MDVSLYAWPHGPTAQPLCVGSGDVRLANIQSLRPSTATKVYKLYSQVFDCDTFFGNRLQKMLLFNNKCRINNFAGRGNATIQLDIPIISKTYKDM